MSLHVHDFMKISKALESSYQRLLSENILESECIERLNLAREEYTKAMLHATLYDEEILQIAKN
ncbi:hypothetical protein [Sutcliffiella halmapala]|uniref:hypothetical protein n=1 Tax=Sutcliffiella halmapala TaxID=79882 RepID=UPI0009950E7B|nr:hypothetical protein [Sutcliffiella halmapala]